MEWRHRRRNIPFIAAQLLGSVLGLRVVKVESQAESKRAKFRRYPVAIIPALGEVVERVPRRWVCLDLKERFHGKDKPFRAGIWIRQLKPRPGTVLLDNPQVGSSKRLGSLALSASAFASLGFAAACSLSGTRNDLHVLDDLANPPRVAAMEQS